MKKILSFLIVLIIAATLTACAKTENNSENGFVSDPFSKISSDNSTFEDISEPDPNDPEQARDVLNQLSVGGCMIDFNNGKTLVYDGKPVKLDVTFAPSNSNSLNCSEGIMVFINELPQEVSADGVNYSYMAVYSELEPGKEYTKELYFKPSVLRGDEDSINVYFANCFNPDYKPQESYLTFGNTHSFAGFAVSLEMTMNADIEQIVDAKIETDIREEIAAGGGRGTNGFVMNNNGRSNGYYLNEDGTLSGTYELSGMDEETTHRIAFFVNDKPVTFNGGKCFCDIEYKIGYKYSFDFTLDEDPKHMDYFYAMDIYGMTNGKIPYMRADIPKIIVRSDYEYKQQ